MQCKQIYQFVVAHHVVAAVCHCQAIATSEARKAKLSLKLGN